MKEMGMEWRNDKEVYDIGRTMEERAAAKSSLRLAFHCWKIVEYYSYTEVNLEK
jgi:hypothetical protein